MLDKLVRILDEKGWRCWINLLKEFDKEELQSLIKSSSKNKWLIKWCWQPLWGSYYIQVELTEKWKEYCANWFKFKEEKENNYY